MKKVLNNPFVVAGLVIVAVLVGWTTDWNPSGSSSGATRVFASAPDTAATSAEVTPLSTSTSSAIAPLASASAILDLQRTALQLSAKEAFTIQQAGEASDGAKPKEQPETYLLKALWHQGGRTFAVINGTICTEGDTIGSVRLQSTSQDSIELVHSRSGKRALIQVGQEATFSPSDRRQRLLSDSK